MSGVGGGATAEPRCPRCTFPLVVHLMGGQTVDVCPRCKGTFLEHVDAEQIIGRGLNALQPASGGGARSSLACPLGHGRLIAYRVLDVEVDVCPTCRGLWLDQWEGVRLKRALASAPVVSTDAPPGQERRGAGWYLFQLFSGLPVEVWNPVAQRAHLVSLFIAANVVAFAAEVVLGGDLVVQAFGMVPSRIAEQPWSMLTHMFLHAGVVHLLGNLWFLHVFGDNIEDTLGRQRFVALYFVTGVAAALAQYASAPGSTLPLVGASGAIAGLMGAYLVLFPRVKVWVVWFFVRFKLGVTWYLALWVGFQALLAWVSLQQGMGNGGVAFFAHVGGFAAGVVGGLLLRRP